MVFTNNDFVFYERRVRIRGQPRMKRIYRYFGLKAEQEGYYYPHLEINRFAEVAEAIHPKARVRTPPTDYWIKLFFYNPALHRIVPQIPPGHDNDTLYQTHDNGGRPFFAYVSPENRVSVYRTPSDAYILDEDLENNDEKSLYTECILAVNAIKVWIGKDPSYPDSDGNSILVQDESGYIFIGAIVYRFTAADPIQEYFSKIGPNDVPYPVALSATHAFMMVDQKRVPRNRFRPNADWLDAYSDYYGHREDEWYGEYQGLESASEPVECSMIQERLI